MRTWVGVLAVTLLLLVMVGVGSIVIRERYEICRETGRSVLVCALIAGAR